MTGAATPIDRTGLYGLFALNGAPIDPADAATLGLPMPLAGQTAIGAAVDLADPTAAQLLDDGDDLTLWLGRLAEPREMAAQLGLAGDAPEPLIARAALRRFGPDMRTRLHGEWTMAQWDGRALVLVGSFALRDPLFYAVTRGRIAIGPDLRQLSRIGGIDDGLDPVGMLCALGTESLRNAVGPYSPVAGITRLRPGVFATFDATGARHAAPAVLQPAPARPDSLDQAVEEAEALLHRIVRQQMVGGSYACLLSGGLDSSTLAWFLARNRRAGEALRLLTSAAVPGSGQIDEFDAAAIVAAHLDVAHDAVVPGATPGAYRPAPDHFRVQNGPSLSPRHYLYHHFGEAARAHGASVLFDGVHGEMTLTHDLPLQGDARRWRPPLRRWLRQGLNWTSGRRGQATGPVPFHVHLTHEWRVRPPDAIRAALALPDPGHWIPRPDERWGISPTMAKAARTPAVLDLGMVRLAMPFRDPRLALLLSGFRAGTLYPEPGGRTPVRHLLRGKLPDSIRLRPKGGGVAPDYADRLIREAPAARERLALFRQAGADAWIDLDALDRELALLARGTAHGIDPMRVQLTALAGEFIAWWRGLS